MPRSQQAKRGAPGRGQRHEVGAMRRVSRSDWRDWGGGGAAGTPSLRRCDVRLRRSRRPLFPPL